MQASGWNWIMAISSQTLWTTSVTSFTPENCRYPNTPSTHSRIKALVWFYGSPIVPGLLWRLLAFCTQPRTNCSSSEQKTWKTSTESFLETRRRRITIRTNTATEANRTVSILSPQSTGGYRPDLDDHNRPISYVVLQQQPKWPNKRIV